MGAAFEDLFEIIDAILFNAFIVAAIVVVAFVIGFVAWMIVSGRRSEKERKEKEEVRLRRLKKVPVENRRCSNCKYGKEKVLSDMTVVECTNSTINSNAIKATYKNGVLEKRGCPYFDPVLGAFLD